MVLVRQRPGSAKGALFLPLEDKTGIASFVVWPKVFEQHRRIILSTSMMAVQGRIQREGEVVHLVVQRVTDLSAELASVGEREAESPLPHGRDDQIRQGGSDPDQRAVPHRAFRARDLVDPHRHLSGLKVKTRDFR